MPAGTEGVCQDLVGGGVLRLSGGSQVERAFVKTWWGAGGG